MTEENDTKSDEHASSPEGAEKKEKLEYTIHIPLYSGCYCPHQYPCGKKPCEDGEECPSKAKPTYVPYMPFPQIQDSPYWTPTVTWTNTGGDDHSISE